MRLTKQVDQGKTNKSLKSTDKTADKKTENAK
jgi:hypothetical protein